MPQALSHTTLTTLRVVHVCQHLGSLPELDAVDNLLDRTHRKQKASNNLRPCQTRYNFMNNMEHQIVLVWSNQVKDSIRKKWRDVHTQRTSVEGHQVQAYEEKLIRSAKNEQYTCIRVIKGKNARSFDINFFVRCRARYQRAVHVDIMTAEVQCNKTLEQQSILRIRCSQKT